MDGITISELAERAGVNASTVRYYERAGLVPDPERSANGYRRYTPTHENRLLFITRARGLGLSIEQIAGLLGVWDGSNCASTRSHMGDLIDTNLTELESRIVELQLFATELREIRSRLQEGPATCDPDLECCTPNMSSSVPVTLTVGRRL